MIKKKNIPFILSILGSMGVIATAVLAVNATPKAIEKIKKDSLINHDGDPNAYTKIEAIKSAWSFYILPTVIGVSTITCIFGATILNNKIQKSLIGVYMLTNESFKKYKEKLKELYGEEANNKIIDELVKEQSKDVYISCPGITSAYSTNFDNSNEERHLFYDEFSKRYFESTFNQVIQAEYHFNRNWSFYGQGMINDFYNFLGIEPVEVGDDLGWYMEDGLMWVDFNHHKTVMDDGLEVYTIEFVFEPRLADDY